MKRLRYACIFQLCGPEAQKLAMSVLNVMSTVLGGSFNAKVCTV